ncbi:MAG: UDP-N-acetylmuramate--L-alanine ligase [Desulfovibrio sp.]|nr:UDP-N-acetylmuramate--L-alanine ligase [Desulfovibrio sp.]
MKNKIKKIHMIGIGGAGMCGIAEILLEQGYEIEGSDLSDSAPVRRLKKLGAKIYQGHSASNLGQAQVVIRSTAISDENPEIIEARARKIAIIPRAEMLAELMRLKQGVAVAGTHGKTTTTSLTASIFEAAGLDPTVIIGGRLNVYGTNARLGKGSFLIAEADESDGSFLCLLPIVNIVTNIDNDHMDFYKSPEEIDEAFLQFMNNAPFYGINIVCGDNARVRKILPRVKRQALTYGFEADNTLRANILEMGRKSRFEVLRGDERLGEVSLPQPGKHNILNALGAIGAAFAADIPFEKCREGLESFKGVGRRFEWKGDRDGVTVIDDYAHHPAEIEATLRTARTVFPDRRIVVAFQPHRFTRSQAFFGDFCKVFANADELLLTEIYAASENPIPGVSGMSLCHGVRQVTDTPARYFQSIEEMKDELSGILVPGDILITMGAGTITGLGPAWIADKEQCA